jgi:hypothetical protein
MATVTLGAKAFFAGGIRAPQGNAPANFSKAVDIYDSASDQWTTARLSVPRSDVTGAGVGNYAIGPLSSVPERKAQAGKPPVAPSGF